MRKLIISSLALLAFQTLAWSDGFYLPWASENNPHLVIQLTPEQVAIVGRERKLVLTEGQRRTLGRFAKKVPPALGVQTLSETDCACHTSCAMWTATNEVTIWLEHLPSAPQRNKPYYEVRRKTGFYVADAKGELFAAGKQVTWSRFEAAALLAKEDNPVHLSLPPDRPKDFQNRVDRLLAKGNIMLRLGY